MNYKFVLCALIALSLTACSTLIMNQSSNRSVSSSLVDFLYPNQKRNTKHTPETPTLRLPVNVGVAFIPSNHWRGNPLHSKNQIQLLNKVKTEFEKYDYINRIEVIPSTYLRGGKGFITLEQVSRLYDVEVMALVSYDQVNQSFENNAALLYWTVVGMYLIPGNENNVQTFVDTAVFDIKSKKMLFRAPGISSLAQRSSAVRVDDVMAEKSLEGFNLAFNEMIQNLDSELGAFKQRVKEQKTVNIERKKGYAGGSTDIISLLLLFVLTLARNVFSACFRPIKTQKM